MTHRALLRSQIVKAWNQMIKIHYKPQRINSERSLQAAFWAELDRNLASDTRRMFIEPRMSAQVSMANGARQTRFPDLVVCNTKEVIGIIELKYQPRSRPNWKKDLETFKWIASHRDQISVSNSRFRGKFVDDKTYPLAEDVLFVWAGVHAEWNATLQDRIEPSLASMFLELHEHTRLATADLQTEESGDLK